MYLMNTRTNIYFFVNTLRHVHLMVAKGTIEYGLKCDMNQNINLEGYVDSNWAGSALQGVAFVWDQV